MLLSDELMSPYGTYFGLVMFRFPAPPSVDSAVSAYFSNIAGTAILYAPLNYRMAEQ